MPIDLSIIAPEARARYIQIGRQWGSRDTLAQANQTLKGCAQYGDVIAKHGFATKDVQRLQDARDALIAAGIDRADALGERKVTSRTYLECLAAGRAARDSARAILGQTRSSLHESASTSARAGVKIIDTAMAQTRVADDDAERLATQLDMLRGALSDGNVAPEAGERGGSEAIVDLQSAAAALRNADAERAGAAGTLAETEQLDLLDGIIVTLARGAFKAARAAAKRAGQPAMVGSFELTKLYGSRPEPAPATPSDGASPSKPVSG
ncbi:Hypothetical protein A7982_10034 [Minicystis rosea]|nr:Hypothetical protein A7982_10034 [Minicystis rosea]